MGHDCTVGGYSMINRYSAQIDYLDMRKGYDNWDKLSKKEKVIHALKNSYTYRGYKRAEEIAYQELQDAVDWLNWEDYENKEDVVDHSI